MILEEIPDYHLWQALVILQETLPTIVPSYQPYWMGMGCRATQPMELGNKEIQVEYPVLDNPPQ